MCNVLTTLPGRTQLLTSSDEMLLWGTRTRDSSRYLLDIENGAP